MIPTAADKNAARRLPELFYVGDGVSPRVARGASGTRETLRRGDFDGDLAGMAGARRAAVSFEVLGAGCRRRSRRRDMSSAPRRLRGLAEPSSPTRRRVPRGPFARAGFGAEGRGGERDVAIAGATAPAKF